MINTLVLVGCAALVGVAWKLIAGALTTVEGVNEPNARGEVSCPDCSDHQEALTPEEIVNAFGLDRTWPSEVLTPEEITNARRLDNDHFGRNYL